MKRLRSCSTAVGLLIASACTSGKLAPVREGFIDVEGGRVWYRVVGRGPKTPLLVLHGGPGVPHYYLKPLAGLADERPVIFYDQLGAGKSDRPTDTTLWRFDRFVNEITRVREALGLKEIHLYGHSWGCELAVAYLMTKPAGVRSVILAGPALSPSRFRHDRDSLMHTLPDSIYSVMVRHERDGTLDAPEYLQALRMFYEHFHARRLPWSADLDSAVASINPIIDRYIGIGRSDTTDDPSERLREIHVPTLFTVGRFDWAPTLATAKYYQSLVPGSRVVVLEKSGHLTMHDEPAKNNDVIREFLRSVESQR